MNKQYYKDYYQKNKSKWKKYYKMRRTTKLHEIRMYEKKRYAENKDKILAYQKTPKARFSFAKSHSKHYKKEWKITFDQYKKLLNQKCFYCNCSLLNMKGIGLDRINNAKGYIMGNVLPCCGDCNYIRQDLLTVEEMKVAMLAILKYRKLNNIKYENHKFKKSRIFIKI